MSLAMYASPFDNDTDNNIIDKKKAHNKTQKRYPKDNIDNQKVNSVIESIHNNSTINNDNENELGDYYSNPPPKPTSIGAMRASTKEGMQTNNLNTLGVQPSSSENDDKLELNNFLSNYADKNAASEYYKKYIPNFNSGMINQFKKDVSNKQYYMTPQQQEQYQTTGMGMGATYSGNEDVLLQKLNYMIHLLEEQQDEKTNNVTEEVVLYSFLGIFIIFIVDGFARVGKYTR